MRAGLRRSSAIVWAATCVLLLALVAAAAWLVVTERRAAIARAGQFATQTVAGAEAELNRALLSLDLQLTSVAEAIAPAWRAGSALDAATAHRVMVAFKDRQLLFNDAALIDASGRTLAASLPSSDRNGMRLPDGFAARVFALGVPQLAISEPAISPATTEPSIYMARLVNLPGGVRALAVVEVPMTGLAAIISQAGAMPGLAITLERDDGELLATAPPGAGLRARRLAPVLGDAQATGAPQLAASRLTGEPAIVAVRPTLYRSLRLAASVPLADVLGAWRASRDFIVVATLALIALTLAGGVLGQWQFNRLADAREALARSVQTLDQALAVMADGFLLCDKDDRVVRWNGRYVEMFPWLRDLVRVGVPFETLASKLVETPLIAASDQQRREWLAERLALHRAGQGEWERDLGNGLVVQVTDRRTPEGGVVTVFRDVTAAERRLAQAKMNAEAANQAKSQFLATMSHEIRTPLNAVLGLHELMLHSPLDAQQQRYAELIGSSGRLLLALINDILDVSRIEAGHMQLNTAPFSVQVAADGVVALMQERALSKGLALRLDLSAAPGQALLGDVIRIQQILFNLVGNAIKFTDRGEVRVGVAVKPRAGSAVWLELAVSDTGIGIPASAMPTLFDRFTQADSTTMRRYGGSGLGLAITRDIVQMMGGTIETSSTPGQGSRFLVTIPSRLAERDEGAAPGLEPAAGDAERPSLRILVAEDNGVNQILISAVLERLGHRAQLVDDGQQAVDAVRAGTWDVVLMDLQMPGMDGMEATQAIRALGGRHARLPIIAMTANAFEADRQACLDAGMDDHLAKPIDVDKLALALERCTRAAQRA